MKSSIIFISIIMKLIYLISGAPTPQIQNQISGSDLEALSTDIYLDPYVILGAIPEMVDGNNKPINLNTVLSYMPSRISIDQVINLTEWFSRSFAYYKIPVAPWVNTVIEASKKAKISSTNAVNSLASWQQFKNSQSFVKVSAVYGQFLVGTEKVMMQQMDPQEYVHGIRQLFFQLKPEQQQIFDKTFQDIYGYSFVNILRETS